MARVRLVLVRPESATNVGASARLIRNTGLDGLDLVAPGDWRTIECWRTAWGAQDVLESARVFEEVAPALEGTVLAVALTGRRRTGSTPGDIREAAEEIAALGPEETAALVLGPETSGLSNEELASCSRQARIPSHPDQPSFNLSHAVAIASYEVRRALEGQIGEVGRRATHEEKERFLALLKEGLLAIDALPAASARSRLREWRALVHRTDVTPRELKFLEHMARKMAASSAP